MYTFKEAHVISLTRSVAAKLAMAPPKLCPAPICCCCSLYPALDTSEAYIAKLQRAVRQKQAAPLCQSRLMHRAIGNMHMLARCCAIQHSAAQHSTAQHSTAQRSTAQRSTAQHSAAQHSTAQHSAAQRSTAQHSTAHLTCFMLYACEHLSNTHESVQQHLVGCWLE